LGNKKSTIVIIITTIGVIIGIFLIIAGILFFWSEGFSNLLIKFISILKNRPADLLINGEPVYTLWLIKLIPLAKASIVAGIFLTIIFLLFLLDNVFFKKHLLSLSLLSLIGLSLIIIGLLFY